MLRKLRGLRAAFSSRLYSMVSGSGMVSKIWEVSIAGGTSPDNPHTRHAVGWAGQSNNKNNSARL